MPTPQHQYITSWHDSFVEYIGSLLGVVAGQIPVSNIFR